MRLGRSLRQQVFGQLLTGEWFGLQGKYLPAGQPLAVDVARGDGTLLKRKQRLAGRAVEYPHMAGFCGLCDSVDHPPSPSNAYQCWSRWKVPIPYIVPHELKMPDPPAGGSIQREQTIREQIVAGAISAIEVERSRSSRHEDQPTLLVEG
jgi:hypothetical protein